MVVHDVFLECVAHLVGEVDGYVCVVWVHLPAAFVDRKEHRLYARCCLCHERRGAGRGYCEACYVAPPMLLHALVKFGIGFTQAVYERIVFLAFMVVDFKRASLGGHVDRC